MKTIVVSGVNIRKGGTLTIMRSCLSYLSQLVAQEPSSYRVVALVHHRDLYGYPHIEYIELPWSIQGWGKRLWCEYVTMGRLGEQLGEVFLWLSMHDTTPRVKAKRQAVYCQTSFPFYSPSRVDWRFDPKIPLFSFLTRFAYQIGIKKNRYLIVQTEWLREGFSKMFHLPRERFIVAPPKREKAEPLSITIPPKDEYTFLYAATPDVHKNFQLLLEATRLLEERGYTGRFRVAITINGKENKYAAWLHERWGGLSSIDWLGLLPKDKLEERYAMSHAMVFPSKVETWGLPISEFMVYDRPMLLADCLYAHETSQGAAKVSYFNPDRAELLADQMQRLIEGDESFLKPNKRVPISSPKADNWQELFGLLLADEEK